MVANNAIQQNKQPSQTAGGVSLVCNQKPAVVINEESRMTGSTNFPLFLLLFTSHQYIMPDKAP